MGFFLGDTFVQRIAEPELMEGKEQAKAYAEADFSLANAQFLQLFLDAFPDFKGPARILDLGCGPGDILIDFAEKFTGSTCLGIDGSQVMLEHGLQKAGSIPQSRVQFQCSCLPFVENLGRWQVILSNSLLHHLKDPATLWQTIVQVAEPGALVLVMDLLRPNSTDAARKIVQKYSGDEPQILQEDFYNSLLAAYRPAEVNEQLARQGLNLHCQKVSDRHLAIWGKLAGPFENNITS